LHIEPSGSVKPDPEFGANGPGGRADVVSHLPNHEGFPYVAGHVGSLLINVQGKTYEVSGPMDIPITGSSSSDDLSPSDVEEEIQISVMINDRVCGECMQDNSGNFILKLSLRQ
jgi:hypothetical protein